MIKMRYDPELSLIKNNIIFLNQTVLDLGCGNGRNIFYFLKEDIPVIGCDIDSEVLMKLFLSTVKYRSIIGLKHMDIRKYFYKYSKDDYSLIILSQVLNFLSSDDIYLLCKKCKEHTIVNGFNYIKVYSGQLKEGFISSVEVELLNYIYYDWEIILQKRYELESDYGYSMIYKKVK